MIIKTNMTKDIIKELKPGNVYYFIGKKDDLLLFYGKLFNDIINNGYKLTKIEQELDIEDTINYEIFIETNRLLKKENKKEYSLEEFKGKETEYTKRAFNNIKDKASVAVYNMNGIEQEKFIESIEKMIKQGDKIFIIYNTQYFIENETFRKDIERIAKHYNVLIIIFKENNNNNIFIL